MGEPKDYFWESIQTKIDHNLLSEKEIRTGRNFALFRVFFLLRNSNELKAVDILRGLRSLA